MKSSRLNLNGYITMPAHSLRQIQARKAVARRGQSLNPSHIIKNDLRFVFSLLVEGCNRGATTRVFNWNDIQTPSEKTFYRLQPIILEKITSYAEESCAYWRSRITPGTTIAMDGSWSHRRNAQKCLVDFIDTSNNKIIDFEVVEKKHGKEAGNFCGSSNQMEIEGVKRFIRKFKNLKNVAGFVHDNDAKTSAAFRTSGWNLTEWIDNNHVRKAWLRKFQNISAEGKPIKGLKERLLRWFNALIISGLPIEQKEEKWLNAYYHYLGNHTNCDHNETTFNWKLAKYEKSRIALSRFLNKSKKLLNSAAGPISSQMCESLHSIKAKYAGKHTGWGNSWKARVLCAVLDVNLPFWKFRLYKELFQDEALSVETYNALFKHEEERVKWNTYRQSAEFRIAEKERRLRKRERDKAGSKDGYKVHPKDMVKSSLKDRVVEAAEGELDKLFQLAGFWDEGTGEEDPDYVGNIRATRQDKKWMLSLSQEELEDTPLQSYELLQFSTRSQSRRVPQAVLEALPIPDVISSVHGEFVKGMDEERYERAQTEL